MKTFRKHLKEKMQDVEFKEMYDEERLLHEFSVKIYQARKKTGLSQKELADKTHISPQQLSQIESGLNCNLKTFLRVCHVLGVEMNLVDKRAIS